MEDIKNYIGGQFYNSYSGNTIPNVNPAIGQQYCSIPDSESDDVLHAIQSAKSAFPSWSSLSPTERASWLGLLADYIEDNLALFAVTESIDNGKPLSLAQRIDIPRAVANLRFFAHAATQFASESHFNPKIGINYTLRSPLGVVACISPWNLPLYLFTWKIAPALAVGNTVVAKPSEVTPYTAYLLSKVCNDIGFPKGVLNIVHGYGHKLGETLCTHDDIKAISFTGGTATGKIIAELAAPLFKKTSLELGGKNPNIIFDDCDFDKMLSTTLLSSFSNQGQICLCGSRILVQRTIYQKFLDHFIPKVKALTVGDPLLETTKIGAIVSETHLNKILSYIQIAKEEGGTILCGGQRFYLSDSNANGYYILPTVIADLDQDCRTNQEEIFGPVVTVMPFDTEEEALAAANNSTYGLASTIWTKDINKAMRISEQLESGIVWVNCWLERDLRTPFGGTKNSGLGSEGGWEAMRFFTEPKNICIKYK